MERTPAQRKHRRQQLRRKYKRYAAAMAGAAIMTGALLPGIPAAKAHAAGLTVSPPAAKTVQTATITGDGTTTTKQVVADKVEPLKWKPRKRGWHEHEHSWPGPNENQILYRDGKVLYRSDGYSDRDYAGYYGSPADYVRDHAAAYGLDPVRDSFTIVSFSTRSAVVQVVKHDTGGVFNAFLSRDRDSGWTIVDFRAR